MSDEETDKHDFSKLFAKPRPPFVVEQDARAEYDKLAARDEELLHAEMKLTAELTEVDAFTSVDVLAELLARQPAIRRLREISAAAVAAAGGRVSQASSIRIFGTGVFTGEEKRTRDINSRLSTLRAALHAHMHPRAPGQMTNGFHHEQQRRKLEDEIRVFELRLAGATEAEGERQSAINRIRALDREIEFFASGRSGDSNRHERLSRLKADRQSVLERHHLTEADILEPATPAHSNEGDEPNA